jgi:hypothetical protein
MANIRRVHFPENVEEQKQCPNGKPIFGKKDVPFDEYFRNFKIRGALGCPNNFIKWNPTTRKYCCHDIPATYDEMIQKTDELLETIEEKGDSNGINDTVLRWKEYFLNLKKIEFNNKVLNEGFIPLKKQDPIILKGGIKKRNKSKRSKNKRSRSKRNKSKRNKSKRNKSKRSKSKNRLLVY